MSITQISITGTSPIEDYNTNEYLIVLSIVAPHYIYGYGYGTSFTLLDGENPNDELNYEAGLDYFNVLSITGTNEGEGVSGTEGSVIGSYSYGWGYEQTPEIAGDLVDEVTVRATIYKNGAVDSPVQSPVTDGMFITFSSGPGITFSSNRVQVNASGIAETVAKADSTQKKNLDKTGSNEYLIDRPTFGYVEIYASIENIPDDTNGIIGISTVGTNLYGSDTFQYFVITTNSYAYSYAYPIA